MDPTDELEHIAVEHDQSQGFTPRLIACRARSLEAVLAPGVVLDLGCADGLLTAALARRHRRVVAVDASPTRIARARGRVGGNVDLVQATFESFAPTERFDGIVLSCVLEHLAEPAALLRHVVPWLVPGGRVVAITPNGASLHRRAGVIMGLLADLGDHGEADHHLGHEQVFDLASLAALFTRAGLGVIARGGHLIKPVPNPEMTRLAPALVDAYEELGRQLPELAAEIYVVGARG